MVQLFSYKIQYGRSTMAQRFAKLDLIFKQGHLKKVICKRVPNFGVFTLSAEGLCIGNTIVEWSLFLAWPCQEALCCANSSMVFCLSCIPFAFVCIGFVRNEIRETEKGQFYTLGVEHYLFHCMYKRKWCTLVNTPDSAQVLGERPQERI